MRSILRCAAAGAVALLLGATATAASAQASSTAAPPAGSTPAPKQLPADSLARARQYTNWFYRSMADSLYAAFSDTLKLQMTSPQALEGGFNQFATQVGVETELLEERWVNRKGRRQYWRTAKFSTFPEPFMLRFVIGTDGKIEGIGMNPKSQAPAIDPSA